jgi:hypothetical protein
MRRVFPPASTIDPRKGTSAREPGPNRVGATSIAWTARAWSRAALIRSSSMAGSMARAMAAASSRVGRCAGSSRRWTSVPKASAAPVSAGSRLSIVRAWRCELARTCQSCGAAVRSARAWEGRSGASGAGRGVGCCQQRLQRGAVTGLGLILSARFDAGFPAPAARGRPATPAPARPSAGPPDRQHRAPHPPGRCRSEAYQLSGGGSASPGICPVTISWSRARVMAT